MLPLALLLYMSECVMATPLIRRQQQTNEDPEAEVADDSSHLDDRWIIVIAVVFSAVVLGVIATVLWVKLRRQRRARGPVQIRSSSPYDVRHSRRSSVSTSGKRQKSAETITMPLPVVTYEKHRNSSVLPPKRAHF